MGAPVGSGLALSSRRCSASAPAIPISPGLERGLTSLGRILIIEDDSAIQRALKRLFESEGYDVNLARDGTAGLELFRNAPPSVLVLDLRLPGRPGEEVCREIKQLAPNLPLIVLSGKSDVVDKVLLLQEFKTLKFMLQNAERVVSREELLTKVWGYQNYPTTRTVDNHILRLRQKLERQPSSPVHFLTVHSAGYKFVP